MELIILASILSFFIAFVTIPVVIRITEAKKLLDLPNDRKIHEMPISSLGGVGIFCAFIFTILVLVPFDKAEDIQYFIASAFLIFFLGVKDDILLISPIKKFSGQFIAAFLMVYPGDFRLTSLHGFLGVYTLHPAVAIIFSFLTIILIINAFNLIDGVDGLAGTLGLMSTLFFGVVFSIEHDYPHAIVAFSLAAGILAFLTYNYSPAKIFMGDTGSLLIGLVNAALVIRFINLETAPDTVLHFNAAPAVGLAVLFIPLADTLRLIITRVYDGKSPFEPDVNHIHHLLLQKGLSHMQATGLISISAGLLSVYGVLAQAIGINFLIFSLFTIALVAYAILKWPAKNVSLSEKETQFQSDEKEVIPTTRILQTGNYNEITHEN